MSKEEYNQYHKEYNKKRYDERIALAIKILGGKCKFCGINENLHIDHIIPSDKEYNIDYATRLSMEKFLLEIAKCQLLCQKCHSFKTNLQNGIPLEHGKGLTGKKSCYCELCKPLKDAYIKEWKAKRK